MSKKILTILRFCDWNQSKPKGEIPTDDILYWAGDEVQGWHLGQIQDENDIKQIGFDAWHGPRIHGPQELKCRIV